METMFAGSAAARFQLSRLIWWFPLYRFSLGEKAVWVVLKRLL